MKFSQNSALENKNGAISLKDKNGANSNKAKKWLLQMLATAKMISAFSLEQE